MARVCGGGADGIEDWETFWNGANWREDFVKFCGGECSPEVWTKFCCCWSSFLCFPTNISWLHGSLILLPNNSPTLFWFPTCFLVSFLLLLLGGSSSLEPEGLSLLFPEGLYSSSLELAGLRSSDSCPSCLITSSGRSLLYLWIFFDLLDLWSWTRGILSSESELSSWLPGLPELKYWLLLLSSFVFSCGGTNASPFTMPGPAPIAVDIAAKSGAYKI